MFTKIYEWQGEKGRKRTPFAARSTNGDVLALAVLCGRAISPGGEVTDSCTILTQPALGPLAPIHGRMPLIVDRSHFGAWLEASTKTAVALDQVRTTQAAMAAALEIYPEDPYELAHGPRVPKGKRPAQGTPPTNASGWRFMLEHHDPDVRIIAARAHREPVLRNFFPYNSLSNLRFSRKLEYPWDPMPWIYVIKDEPRSYRLLSADHERLAEGDLDTVVTALVRVMAAR